MAIHQKTPPVLRPRWEKVLFWILHSPLRSTTAVIAFGVSASLLECVIHLSVRTSSASPLVQALADSIILGIFAAFFGFVLLMAARERRHKVQEDLRRIAELNHQVRNSLQIIVYGERSTDVAERRSAVVEGVEKIESTLRELFPLVGERRNDERPWEAHNQVCLQNHNFSHDRRRQPTQVASKPL
jgi:ABC-type multidrug transport system fused ATPase/permease subunit